MLTKLGNQGSLDGLPLESLAELANESARDAEQHAKSTVRSAIASGRYLLAAKSQVAHGQWLDWLAANWEYSVDLANKYMRIANSEGVMNLQSASSISEALRMIADAKAEKEPDPQPELFEEEADVVAEETGFTCSTCKEEFSVPVWHCEGCGNHWDQNTEDCSICQHAENAEPEPDDEPETAEEHEEEAEAEPPTPPKPYLTADEWNELHSDLQLTIRSKPETFGRTNATFNKQDSSSIEWAQWSWNPITGCKHDCPYCYARDIANRFYPQKFEPSIYPERFLAPQNTKVPDIAKENVAYKNVFTCSMADLFGRWVPLEWIEWVMQTVADNPQWNFLFLTKFPQRFAELGELPNNAWMGTTVDCQSRVKNAEKAFAKVKGGTKWLSVEPMLTPLKFDRLDLFNWVVIGGASASAKTPAWVPPFDWVVDLHWQARDAGCAVYHKDSLKMSDNEFRLREFPWEQNEDRQLPDALKYLDIA